MGFGVSGSTAIVFLGLFIASGTLFTAASASFEQVNDARDGHQEQLLDRRNTEITVLTAEYNSTLDELTLDVANNGSVTLEVDETTVLIDNGYQSTAPATVDGDATTNLWAPGETLRLTVSTTTAPSRVKVVTESGIADSADVTVVS